MTLSPEWGSTLQTSPSATAENHRKSARTRSAAPERGIHAGPFRVVVHDDSPPIIACLTPAAKGQLVCEPLLVSQTYPAGKPMYENDVTR